MRSGHYASTRLRHGHCAQQNPQPAWCRVARFPQCGSCCRASPTNYRTSTATCGLWLLVARALTRRKRIDFADHQLPTTEDMTDPDLGLLWRACESQNSLWMPAIFCYLKQPSQLNTMYIMLTKIYNSYQFLLTMDWIWRPESCSSGHSERKPNTDLAASKPIFS